MSTFVQPVTLSGSRGQNQEQWEEVAKKEISTNSKKELSKQ